MSKLLALCLCSHCAQTALFELGISALSPQQFITRSKRYHLTDEQQRIVDVMKLQIWNDSVKGRQG